MRKIIETIKKNVMEKNSNVQDITEITVNKNGKELKGLQLSLYGYNAAPVFYLDEENAEIEETVSFILDRIKKIPEFDMERIMSREYILENAEFSIQRPGFNKEYVTKSLFNQELVLRVKVFVQEGSEGSAKIRPENLYEAGLSKEEVWEAAAKNMEGKFQIINISDMFGMFMPVEPKLKMFVVQDAAVLAFPEVFRRFCISQQADSCWILPSSTEEVIVLPEGEVKRNSAEMLEMVMDINNQVVDPLIWLEPAVYKYSLSTNQINMVACCKNAITA